MWNAIECQIKFNHLLFNFHCIFIHNRQSPDKCIYEWTMLNWTLDIVDSFINEWMNEWTNWFSILFPHLSIAEPPFWELNKREHSRPTINSLKRQYCSNVGKKNKSNFFLYFIKNLIKFVFVILGSFSSWPSTSHCSILFMEFAKKKSFCFLISDSMVDFITQTWSVSIFSMNYLNNAFDGTYVTYVHIYTSCNGNCM